jgi:hypothetical protein
MGIGLKAMICGETERMICAQAGRIASVLPPPPHDHAAIARDAGTRASARGSRSAFEQTTASADRGKTRLGSSQIFRKP